MCAVMEAGQVAAVATSVRRQALPPRLTTTLYDLITTLQDEVDPNNDALVVATMVRLLHSGRLTVSKARTGRRVTLCSL